MTRLLLTSAAAITLLAAPLAASAATKAVTKTTTTTTTTTKMRPTHVAMRTTKHTPMRARPSDSPGTDALNDQALAAARGTGPAPVPAAR